MRFWLFQTKSLLKSYCISEEMGARLYFLTWCIICFDSKSG